MRILFVEDDVEIGTMYATQLVMEENDVVHARSAQEALDILDEYEFDLIVLDILLPGSNGIAVLQELRSYRDWRQIPVIVLSNVNPEDLEVSEQHLKDLGIREYLVKMDTTPQNLAAAVAAFA
ncbi:MAG: response regulator [Candidatus Saccharimonadales bacterium]